MGCARLGKDGGLVSLVRRGDVMWLTAPNRPGCVIKRGRNWAAWATEKDWGDSLRKR